MLWVAGKAELELQEEVAAFVALAFEEVRVCYGGDARAAGVCCCKLLGGWGCWGRRGMQKGRCRSRRGM